MIKSKYNRIYYLKNKEKLDKYRLEWQRKNRDKTREWNKQSYKKFWVKNNLRNKNWAINHRKRAVKIAQAYVRRNQDKVKNYNKRFTQTLEGKYRLLKYRHCKRFEDLIITMKDFSKLVIKKCIYCGGEANKGIDRIDNTKGYTKENSVSCCKICNYMKRDLFKEQFLNHVIKIYKCQNFQ